jgi:oligopeptide/dipeptide ABC transporter ATP-binding protein
MEAGDPMSGLLRVEGLEVQFFGGDRVTQAVRGIDYEVDAGEVLAVLGESGSGKTVAALAVAGILEAPPARISSGRILLDGEDLLAMNPRRRRREVQGERVAMVFQDALAALNPAYPVGVQIAESYRIKRGVSRAAARRRAVELMDRVRIPAAASRVDDYPHQFSGGMRQRIVIAMACALDPQLLIADEPTTALDVTVQGEIIDLLDELRRDSGMAMILISHDLGVVARIADRVAVMYAGRIVETGRIDDVYRRPTHPYTRALLAAVPRADVRLARLRSLPGMPPPLTEPIVGCAFAARCPLVQDVCRETDPPLVASRASQSSACLFHERVGDDINA